MADTATIDLISYSKAASSNSANTSSASRSSSGAAVDFSNVLSKANKNYTENKQSSSNTSGKTNNKTNNSTDQKINKNQEADSTNNTDNEQGIGSDTAEDTNVETTTNNNNSVTEEKESTVSNSETQVAEQDIKDESAQVKDSTQDVLAKYEADISTQTIEETPQPQQIEDQELSEQIIEPQTTATPLTQQMVTVAENSTKDIVKTNPQNNQKIAQNNSNDNNNDSQEDITQAINTTVLNSQAVVDTSNSNTKNTVTQTSKESTDEMASDINTNSISENVIELLALNSQISDSANQQNNVIQAQDSSMISTLQNQTNEVLSPDFSTTLNKLNSAQTVQSGTKTQKLQNTQVNQMTQQADDSVANLPNNAAQSTTDSVPVSSATVQTDSKIPLVAVDASDVPVTVNNEQSDTKTNADLKNILDKAGMNQDILDKTNAKIISVQSSTSSNTGSNNFKQNNTEDQIVKLSIEDNNATKSGMVQFLNDSTQNNFGKTLDSVSAQTVTHQQEVPQELNNTDITTQINNKLSDLKNDNLTKVNIVLKPENLGKINLELVNTKEGLTAQLTTDNPQVKEILDKSLDNLKDNLGNHGIAVSNVTVKVETTEKQSNDMTSFHNQNSENNQKEFDDSGNSNKERTYKGQDSNDEGITTSLAGNEQDIETEEPTIEKSISIGSGIGKVDYKI